MKLVIYLVAIVLIVIGAVYLLVPANALPSFLPGFDPSLTRIRLKHGLATGGLGITLFVVGWWLGRSKR